MTTIFADNPTDSGAILDRAIVDTYVLEAGQPTRPMNPYLATAPAQSALRRTTDQHAAIEVPHTWIYPPIGPAKPSTPRPPGPTNPPVPAPPPPCRCGCRETDKRLLRRGTRRRAAAPAPAWAWLLTGAGLMLLSQAGAGLAALAVTR